MSNHVSVRLSQADSFGTTDFTGLHVVPHFLNVLLLGKTGCNAFANVDVLFCKKPQSGSTVCFLSVLTLAPWAPLCSKRSHIQLDRREVWRPTARVSLSPSYIIFTGLSCSCTETTDASMNTRFNYLPLDEVGVFFMQNKHNVTMLSQ